MLSDAVLYNENHGMQERDTKLLLSSVVKKMDWTHGEQQLVMDVGCGSGYCCRQLLLPVFPSVKKIVAIDLLPEMIEFARKKNVHEKIEYHVANVEDWDSIKRWKEQISKVFSIYCFNWLQNQRKAFQNIFQVLKPEGEAVFLFAITSVYYEAHFDIINDPKWSKYLQGCDPRIPESHYKKQGAAYFRNMLTEIGFNVKICEEEEKVFSYVDDETAKAAYYGRCGLSQYVPQELKDEFAEDFFQVALKRNGRNSEGKAQTQYTSLTLLLQKPQA